MSINGFELSVGRGSNGAVPSAASGVEEASAGACYAGAASVTTGMGVASTGAGLAGAASVATGLDYGGTGAFSIVF